MLRYKKIFESQLNKKINIIKNDRDENMKHYLVNYVFKMILSTKLLLLIQHNKMILRNVNQTLKKIMNIMLISLGVP
jgi:hypothetical protein